MQGKEEVLNVHRRTLVLLFLISLAWYGVYFHGVFLHLNSVLCSITLDSVKNYFTFAYHAANDKSFLEFTGMNYPFGEHVVYTDCQPLFSGILRLLPFTHSCLAGIMHAAIFLSFIVTPLILYTIFIKLSVERLSATVLSLCITLLCPQFAKINAGHFALAYGCVIPLAILLLLLSTGKRGWRWPAVLAVYTSLLFLIHPYLGFGVAVFSLLCHLAYAILKRDHWPRVLLKGIACGILPVMAFRIFMLLTDHHENRTEEPYGLDVMVENITTLLVPEFGPLANRHPAWLPGPTQHFEGHSYLGAGTILLMLSLIVITLWKRKEIKADSFPTAIALAGLALLFISFGWHRTVAGWLNFESPSINQFRAVSRFAYFFYFALPVFLVPLLSRFLSGKQVFLRLNAMQLLSMAVLLLTAAEAHGYLTRDKEAFWKYRNIFNESLLNGEEQRLREEIRKNRYQALLPLPVFHGGSEVFDRAGSNNSYIPAMLYAFHTGVPVFSVLMSRTSVSETAEALELLNCYKPERPVLKEIGDDPFFVIYTRDQLMPDEKRLLPKVSWLAENDSLRFGNLNRAGFLHPLPATDIIEISGDSRPSENVLYIRSENRKPFLTSNMNDYERLADLEANALQADDYVVSFHIHSNASTYRGLALNLIITKTSAGQTDWEYNVPVRLISGFYRDFRVFEYGMRIEKDCRYEFLLKGFIDEPYRVSSFLLRPAGLTVITNSEKGKTFNNFPERE